MNLIIHSAEVNWVRKGPQLLFLNMLLKPINLFDAVKSALVLSALSDTSVKIVKP